jgi:hypothetical protein
MLVICSLLFSAPAAAHTLPAGDVIPDSVLVLPGPFLFRGPANVLRRGPAPAPAAVILAKNSSIGWKADKENIQSCAMLEVQGGPLLTPQQQHLQHFLPTAGPGQGAAAAIAEC